MEIVILTGMSGAGKTVAANYLEDMGYFCVDNAPLQMLESMLQTFEHWEENEGVLINKIAFVVDVRSVSIKSPDEMVNAFKNFIDSKYPHRIIYLEASDQAIINRYKQSRRNHPLAKEKGIVQALEQERKIMSEIKDISTDVIDTTNIELLEFKDRLYKLLASKKHEAKMTILIQSFGFKYGVPVDCDNIIDVRFIPNPFYDPILKPFCGLDQEIKDYVFSFSETKEFMGKLKDLLIFTIPYYIREGKVRLNIGIGCTGGRHRSVALANELGEILKSHGFEASIYHRDLENDVIQEKRK